MLSWRPAIRDLFKVVRPLHNFRLIGSVAILASGAALAEKPDNSCKIYDHYFIELLLKETEMFEGLKKETDPIMVKAYLEAFDALRSASVLMEEKRERCLALQ